MKMILVLGLLALSLQGIAQSESVDMNGKQMSPGDHLELFTTNYYTGTALAFLGSGVSTFGYFQEAPVLMAGGGIIALVGYAITLSSFNHVRKAGRKMNEQRIDLTSDNQGVGIRLRL